MYYFISIFVLFISFSFVVCLNNGQALTPPMGFNTWNDLGCKNMNEQNVLAAAQGMAKTGLLKAGFKFFNLDDCWAKGRFTNGTVFQDPKAFPNGMKFIGDKLHSMGFLYGIYTDRGTLTCQRRPGSLNHEKIDAKTYAEWGVDYVKEDSCFASNDHKVAFSEYEKMRDALNQTGRAITFSLCGWHSWYSPVGTTIGNLWRISHDVVDFKSMVNAINENAPLANNAGPGGWNDPDMLLGSNPKTARYLTPTQSRTQFSMWAVMAAPLLIGADPAKLSAFDLQTYTNDEVIRVSQDKLGVQGSRIWGGTLSIDQGVQQGTNVWCKRLQSGAYALIFINVAASDVAMSCDEPCIRQTTLFGRPVVVRDLWLHKNVVTTSNLTSFKVDNVEANGGSAMFLFTPQ